MSSDALATRQQFQELRPGDRVEIDHEVKVGLKRWHVTTAGTVVSTERRLEGLHFDRNPDDKVFCDVIVLRRDDGELTTATLDEFTALRRLPPTGS